jgi:hypothetical protein
VYTRAGEEGALGWQAWWALAEDFAVDLKNREKSSKGEKRDVARIPG